VPLDVGYKLGLRYGIIDTNQQSTVRGLDSPKSPILMVIPQ